jgi:BASS family bile acid:Na+ symporter
MKVPSTLNGLSLVASRHFAFWVLLSAAIGAIIGVNADKILSAAFTIFAVVILHNLFGLLLGYGAGSALGATEPKKRAIAVEVGMQNSGLAVALAMAHFNPVAAIPGAIFSVWHNISGPILATWWTRGGSALERKITAN